MARSSSTLPVIAAVLLGAAPALASDVGPEVTAWKLNLSDATGSSTIPTIDAVVSLYQADVQRVRHDDTDVYVNATGVPVYDVGPWGINPAVATDRNYLYRFPKSPTEMTGQKYPTPDGPSGLWVNGVAFFNAKSAESWNDEDVWEENAVVMEAANMDAALGHPAPIGGMIGVFVVGEYHHHQRPIALMAQLGDDGSDHSPILGFAFDGFPIYGPWGYENTDGTGAVARMESSFRLRTNLRLPPPMGPGGPHDGTYVQDYEYVEGLGDLDSYNGHVAVTPDYPEGIYHYHATIDANGNSAFPYTVSHQYYGVLALDNVEHNVVAPDDLGACRDGLDDDDDGLPDYPLDVGCYDEDFSIENPRCQDGISNDGDGLVDFDGGESIHGECSGGSCPPGVSDPNLDGVADIDPQCVNKPYKNKENTGCGLGFELALLLGPLGWLRARRRRG